MANKNLFNSTKTSSAPIADTVNNAGGKAYSLPAKAALAQLAATNCFNGTYYSSEEELLKITKDLLNSLRNDPQYLVKVAIYSRNNAFMKDMPAFIMAYVATIDKALFRKNFLSVIDSGKMLRNFAQICRSDVFGKKANLSSGAYRKAIDGWFAVKSPENIFRNSIGNDPSMADVIKMARPKPATKQHAALFAYLINAELNQKTNRLEIKDKEGKVHVNNKKVKYSHPFKDLPVDVQNYENFKKGETTEVPNVDFRMLTNLKLTDKQWQEICLDMSWTATRMNLETMNRHNVFNDNKVVDKVANKLRDKTLIEKAKVFPYQLLAAYQNTENVPSQIKNALHDAMEIAVENVPSFNGKKVVVAVDVSGSMSSNVTGNRGSASSKIRCIDVAALVGSTILRKNKDAMIIPFDGAVHKSNLSGYDSILTNATKLASYGGGSTNCGAVLQHINEKNIAVDLVIYVSDNESNVDTSSIYGRGTAVVKEWDKVKTRNKNAKLVCIDLVPNITTQIKDRKDILNIGGFSDNVFEIISNFISDNNANHWVEEIEAINID